MKPCRRIRALRRAARRDWGPNLGDAERTLIAAGGLATFEELHDLTPGLGPMAREAFYESLPLSIRQAMSANVRTRLEAERAS